MPPVRVSAKYQVVIPRSVRGKAGIEPGDQVEVFIYDGQIRVIPVRPMKEMRGFAGWTQRSLANQIRSSEMRRAQVVDSSPLLH